MFRQLLEMAKALERAAHLMVGVPDYEAYAAHMRVAHPDRPVMSYAEFFRERQQARYDGARAGRCC